MIRFTLSCDQGHGFEGWFSSGSDFDGQVERGLVSCPLCGSASVSKQLMAPSIATARKREETRALIMDDAQKQVIDTLRALVSSIRENAEDVGERFAEEARKVHYGEAEVRGLIGKATMDEARELSEEGIRIAPLPFLPDDAN